MSILSPDPDRDLTTLLARLIDAIRINKTVEVQYGTKTFLLKRRYAGRSGIIWAGNLFLMLSNSQIVMFPDAKAWQEWEIHSFRLLYRAECMPVGTNAVMSEKLPGMSLKHYLEARLLDGIIMEAAGREFRRAHALHSSLTGRLWSHGDPHLDNVLFDPETRNAYLIDFETQHWKNLDATQCHVDDLLVFLLDLMGRSPDAHWKSLSQIFLTSYGQTEIFPNLNKRLMMPRGLKSVLWKTRTANMATKDFRYRLTELREVVSSLV